MQVDVSPSNRRLPKWAIDIQSALQRINRSKGFHNVLHFNKSIAEQAVTTDLYAKDITEILEHALDLVLIAFVGQIG